MKFSLRVQTCKCLLHLSLALILRKKNLLTKCQASSTKKTVHLIANLRAIQIPSRALTSSFAIRH